MSKYVCCRDPLAGFEKGDGGERKDREGRKRKQGRRKVSPKRKSWLYGSERQNEC